MYCRDKAAGTVNTRQTDGQTDGSGGINQRRGEEKRGRWLEESMMERILERREEKGDQRKRQFIQTNKLPHFFLFRNEVM